MAPLSFKLNTGHQMPAVGLGTWQGAPGTVANAVAHALKVGYRLIDAAYCYGNEDEVGEGLKKAFDAGYCKREDVFVMTKLWNTYATRAELGLSKSLKALGLDYVDLFLVHWPVGMNPNGNDDRFPKLADNETRDITWDHDHVATWKQMEALLDGGKTKSIGVCNYSVPYMQQLLKHAKVVPAINQIENSPALPQQDIVDMCREKGIHVVAYSPLGSTNGPLLKNEVVQRVKERKGLGKGGEGTILLSYHVARGVTVLAKSVDPGRIEANFKIIDLDAEDMEMLKVVPATVEENSRRIVNPPFGINLGFPDKQNPPKGVKNESMPNGYNPRTDAKI
ncbi:NADP-dependent oxidoreductase domain-containing protein [Xylariaceae sp. FL0016]|nr:NADP-dependent oxidoreductase domain-containing protein [Xylariaceae sp. FL0016]